MPQPSSSPAPAAGEHGTAASLPRDREGQQREAPRGDAGEVPVGRHRDPDRRRRHGDERRGAAGRSPRRTGPAPPRRSPRPHCEPTSRHSSPAHAPPLEPDAVEPHERQQGAGRMAGDVGDPRIRAGSRGFGRRERPDGLGDVGDRRHLAQVLVACGSRRPAKPRCQPSIIASENAHAHAVAHVTQGTARHGSRWATAGPHSTAATPMTIAGTVPQPTWAFHHPKIGAVCGEHRDLRGRAVDQAA